MNDTQIGDGCDITKAIIAEDVVIGNNVTLGTGEEVANETDPTIYTNGIVTIGEQTTVPDNVSIGKNSVVSGNLTKEDFEDGGLGSGKTLIKAGDEL
jgi:glucose-1-phosphate adenylyltransferase